MKYLSHLRVPQWALIPVIISVLSIIYLSLFYDDTPGQKVRESLIIADYDQNKARDTGDSKNDIASKKVRNNQFHLDRPDASQSPLIENELFNNARALYRKGRPHEAIRLLDSMIRNGNYKNYQAILLLYEIYLENERLEDAVNLMKEAINYNNGNIDFKLKLAAALDLNNATRNTNEAEHIIIDILNDDPTNVEALEIYKQILFNNGDYPYYLAILSDKIRQYPERSDLYTELASAYLNTSDFNSAEQIYIEGILNNPDNAELKRALADLLATAGRSQEAIDFYEKYTKLNPTDGYGFLQLGNLYSKLGFSDKADYCYKVAINISPGYQEEINRYLASVAQPIAK
jgi:tetratricopeptide (TPR) repeat protein